MVSESRRRPSRASSLVQQVVDKRRDVRGEASRAILGAGGRLTDQGKRKLGPDEGRDIVAVAHGGTVRAAVAHALGLAPEQGMAITVGTLSVSVLEHVKGGLLRGRGGAWRVVGINRRVG